jgi:hypothetical protein
VGRRIIENGSVGLQAEGLAHFIGEDGMLEEKVERLTSEIVKLREAIEKNKGGAAAGSTAGKPAEKTAEKTKPGKAKSKYTPDQIKAAVIKVKDDIDADAAKAIIDDAGCSGLAELITMTEKFDEVMAACEAALAGGGDEDDELGGL